MCGSEPGQSARNLLAEPLEELIHALALEQHGDADIVLALHPLLRVIQGSITASSEDVAEDGQSVHLLAKITDERLVRVDEAVLVNVPVLLGEVHTERDIQLSGITDIPKTLDNVREGEVRVHVVELDATDGDGTLVLRPQALAVGLADDGLHEGEREKVERETIGLGSHVTDDPCVECG